jgi:hypothetical protein
MVEADKVIPSIEGSLIYCRYFVVVEVIHEKVKLESHRLTSPMLPIRIYSPHLPPDLT